MVLEGQAPSKTLNRTRVAPPGFDVVDLESIRADADYPDARIVAAVIREMQTGKDERVRPTLRRRVRRSIARLGYTVHGPQS